MGTLANKIDSLPTQDRHLEDWSNTRTAWLAGFDTGLYEAANLAKEADELIETLFDAVWRVECGLPKEIAIDSAINAYKQFKERTK